MLPSISERIQNKRSPRPEETIRIDHMSDLPPEEKQRLKSENRFTREENSRRAQEARQEKFTACPIFSTTLSCDEVAMAGELHIRLVIRYEGLPNGEDLPVIFHKTDGYFERDASSGLYQLYKDAGCDPDSRVPSEKRYGCLRRPRDANGRFIPIPDLVVAEDEGWFEMRRGDEFTHSATLSLRSNAQWYSSLVEDQDYWLRFAVPNVIPDMFMPQFRNWRFGTLQNIIGQHIPQERTTWRPILLSTSNAVKFHLCSMAPSASQKSNSGHHDQD